MKKLFSTIALSIIIITLNFSVSAQTQSIQVNPNQTIRIRTALESTTTIEMMGQEIKMTMDGVFNNQVKIDKVSSADIAAQYKIDSFHIAMKAMTNNLTIDSEHPDTANTKEIQMIDAIKKVSYSLKISPKGALLSQELKNSSLSDELTTLLQQVSPETILSTIFLILPPDSKVGTKWTNTSTQDSNNTTTANYELIAINGDETTVAYNSIIHTKVSKKINGMDAVMISENSNKGEMVVNMKTGVVKTTKFVADGDGTIEVMGQSVPIATKSKGMTTTDL